MASRGGGGFPSREGLSARTYGNPVHLHADPEQQLDFDSEIEGLRGQVGRLKEMSNLISEENKLQKHAAESLEETLEKTRQALRKAMKRLNRVYEQAKGNHFLYLALFCLGTFSVIFLYAKFVRLVGWLR